MPNVGDSQSHFLSEGSSGVTESTGAHPENMSMGHSEPEGSVKADHDISIANEFGLFSESQQIVNDEQLQQMLGQDKFDQEDLQKLK